MKIFNKPLEYLKKGYEFVFGKDKNSHEKRQKEPYEKFRLGMHKCANSYSSTRQLEQIIELQMTQALIKKHPTNYRQYIREHKDEINKIIIQKLIKYKGKRKENINSLFPPLKNYSSKN
jgi:phosphoenolpyruvate carboxylase